MYLTIQSYSPCFLIYIAFKSNKRIQSLEVVFNRGSTQTSFENLSTEFPFRLLLTALKPRFFAVVLVGRSNVMSTIVVITQNV